MFVNGINLTIRTPLSRFKEEQHRNEMKFVRMTKGSQGNRNKIRLQMAHFHSGLVKLTRSAMAKFAKATRQSLITPSTRQVHFVELKTEIAEGLCLADQECSTNSENYIDTDDILSTTTANSEDQLDHLMLMRDQNRRPPRVVKPPTIPHEEGNTNRIFWKTKANGLPIICH